ncbi:MAG: hypothetical protein JW917_00650 [Ignavibacteria bacterium]|nr:hypothetical protein [Ignavibacteria bacterium]
MKKLILVTLILFLFSTQAFPIPVDTTFTAILNEDENPVSISAVLKEFTQTLYDNGKPFEIPNKIFTLTVNGKSVSDTLPYDEIYGIEIIDINRNDKSKEIMIYSGGSPDYIYWIYKYTGDLILLAKTDFYLSFTTEGMGKISGQIWAGFCSLYDTFILSDDGNRLELQPVDYYPIKYTYDEDGIPKDYIVTAVKSFKIYSERNPDCTIEIKKVKDDYKYTVKGYDENSVAAEIEKGEKVTLTGYDPKFVKVNNPETGNEDPWVWIQMKTGSGKIGWILMHSYDQFYWNEFVDGVFFAG